MKHIFIWFLMLALSVCYAQINVQDIEKLIAYKNVSNKFELFQQCREQTLKEYHESGLASNYNSRAWSVEEWIKKFGSKYLQLIDVCLKNYAPSDKSLRNTYWRLHDSYRDKKASLQQRLVVLETIRVTEDFSQTKDSLMALITLFSDSTFDFYREAFKKSSLERGVVLDRIKIDSNAIKKEINVLVEEFGFFDDPELDLYDTWFLQYADVIFEVHQTYRDEAYPSFVSKLEQYLKEVKAAVEEYNEKVAPIVYGKLELGYKMWMVANSCKYEFATYILDVEAYNKLIDEVRSTPNSPVLQKMADELESSLRPWINKRKWVKVGETKSFAFKLKKPAPDVIEEIKRDAVSLKESKGLRFIGELKPEFTAEKYARDLLAKYPDLFEYAIDLPVLKTED